MTDKIKNITVLLGGWSSEKEVSLKSGEYISSVLENMGYKVYRLLVKKDLRYMTEELYKSDPDFIFNLLHGTGGEDGIIQGLLEVFGKPYSNSGVLASAICFNKSICKKIAKLAGANVIPSFEISANDISKLGTEFEVKYPFIVKPSENGSSVGVFLIANDEDLKKLKSTPWTFGNEVLIEDYISGREFTTLIVNGKIIGSVEIKFKNEFYDYESKYDVGGSSHIPNFELNQKQIETMHDMAKKIYKACHCKGAARADFRYNGKDIFFLELNTQTGMTELSLAPDIAKFNNIKVEQLLQMEMEK